MDQNLGAVASDFQRWVGETGGEPVDVRLIDELMLLRAEIEKLTGGGGGDQAWTPEQVRQVARLAPVAVAAGSGWADAARRTLSVFADYLAEIEGETTAATVRDEASRLVMAMSDSRRCRSRAR